MEIVQAALEKKQSRPSSLRRKAYKCAGSVDRITLAAFEKENSVPVITPGHKFREISSSSFKFHSLWVSTSRSCRPSLYSSFASPFLVSHNGKSRPASEINSKHR